MKIKELIKRRKEVEYFEPTVEKEKWIQKIREK